MKKNTKNFLIGVGTIVVGAIAYKLLSKNTTENKSASDKTNIRDTKEEAIVSDSAKEFVERRKQRATERKAMILAEHEQSLSQANLLVAINESEQEDCIEDITTDETECSGIVTDGYSRYNAIHSAENCKYKPHAFPETPAYKPEALPESP